MKQRCDRCHRRREGVVPFKLGKLSKVCPACLVKLTEEMKVFDPEPQFMTVNKS